MTEPEIDYAAVFRALPGVAALLTPQLVYADANEEFLRLAGRTREQLVGHYLPDDFADKLDDPAVAVRRNIEASLRRVAETGQRDAIALQRYDAEDPDRPGVREERFWSWINAPIVGPDGRVALVLHRVEEVTELIRAREVALSLQEAMLPAPGPAGDHRAAVRYRPATGALNVGGDWYDLAGLPGDRLAVAVGDVAGGEPAEGARDWPTCACPGSSLVPMTARSHRLMTAILVESDGVGSCVSSACASIPIEQAGTRAAL